jgi:hypothetical protein
MSNYNFINRIIERIKEDYSLLNDYLTKTFRPNFAYATNSNRMNKQPNLHSRDLELGELEFKVLGKFDIPFSKRETESLLSPQCHACDDDCYEFRN